MTSFRARTICVVLTALLVPGMALADAFAITRALSFGSTGDDVRTLQEILARDPSIYPEGLVSGYFGSLTRAAVRRLQERERIAAAGDEASTGYGRVGPRTRAVLERFSESRAPTSSSEIDRIAQESISSDEEFARWFIDAMQNLRVSTAALSSGGDQEKTAALIENLKVQVAELHARMSQLPVMPTSAQSIDLAELKDCYIAGKYLKDSRARAYPDGASISRTELATIGTPQQSAIPPSFVADILAPLVCRNGLFCVTVGSSGSYCRDFAR